MEQFSMFTWKIIRFRWHRQLHVIMWHTNDEGDNQDVDGKTFDADQRASATQIFGGTHRLSCGVFTIITIN